MKYIQTSAFVIAALLGNEVQAVKLATDQQQAPVSMAQTFDSTFSQKFEHYKQMSDKDLFALIEKKTKEEPAKETKKEDAVAGDAEAKAIEKIVAQRVWNRIAGEGYPTYGYYPYYYPYSHDIAAKAAAVAAYHDVIARAEAINAIAGLVGPSADLALKILEGQANKDAKPKEGDKPKETAFMQLTSKGVPVTVDPHNLLVNEMADADLKQRDFIIDGINGIDFVQTKSEGVPVTVDPKDLLVNECPDCDLKQRDYIIDGINGIDFVQLNSDLKRPIQDTVTLMVKGVPVTVNPESIMRDNTMGGIHLGVDLEVGYNTEVLNLVQTDAQMKMQNPVWNPPFNNWSVNQPSVPHDHGDSGHQDLELRDLIIDGVNGYDLVQTGAHHMNPVVNPPFNNWSVNQPSVPHDHGLGGKEDLGEDMIVGGDPVHYSKKQQTKAI